MATQLSPGENNRFTCCENNRFDHLSQSGSELPQDPIATCPMDKRNQILLTRQSSGETSSELLLVTIAHKTKTSRKKPPQVISLPKLSSKRGSTLSHKL
jgi:hypothetical protein